MQRCRIPRHNLSHLLLGRRVLLQVAQQRCRHLRGYHRREHLILLRVCFHHTVSDFIVKLLQQSVECVRILRGRNCISRCSPVQVLEQRCRHRSHRRRIKLSNFIVKLLQQPMQRCRIPRHNLSHLLLGRRVLLQVAQQRCRHLRGYHRREHLILLRVCFHHTVSDFIVKLLQQSVERLRILRGPKCISLRSLFQVAEQSCRHRCHRRGIQPSSFIIQLLEQPVQLCRVLGDHDIHLLPGRRVMVQVTQQRGYDLPAGCIVKLLQDPAHCVRIPRDSNCSSLRSPIQLDLLLGQACVNLLDSCLRHCCLRHLLRARSCCRHCGCQHRLR